MKTRKCVMLQQIIEKRLARKKALLREMEIQGMSTPEEKRRYIITEELIRELETVIDMADTMFEHTPDSDCVKPEK